MEHIKYCRNINTENAHNKNDIDICGSPSLGYVHGEIVKPSFYIIQQTEKIQPTPDRCNSLFALNLLSLPHSEYRST